MNKSVIFHAKCRKGDQCPNHTLMFTSEDESLLCTYAKPHKGLDSYSRVQGRKIAGLRMNKLQRELQELTRMSIDGDCRSTVKRCLPGTVLSTLPYYVRKAMRALRIDDENPKIVIRGLWTNWEEKDQISNGHLHTVKTESIIVYTHLKTVTPKENGLSKKGRASKSQVAQV